MQTPRLPTIASATAHRHLEQTDLQLASCSGEEVIKPCIEAEAARADNHPLRTHLSFSTLGDVYLPGKSNQPIIVLRDLPAPKLSHGQDPLRTFAAGTIVTLRDLLFRGAR